MCRMIAVISQGNTNAFKLVRQSVKQWAVVEGQKDGVGIGYIDDGVLTIEKSGHSAENVEFTGDAKKSNVVVGHVRWATQGAIDEFNAHPFLSEDGSMMLMHNGNFTGQERLKKHLIKRGHVFESQTDSEVLLHSIEEWGKHKLVEQMEKWGVKGFANWILIEKDGTVTAFSDGAINISHDDNRIIVATNTVPFKSGIEWAKLKSGYMVNISPDGSMKEEFIGLFPGTWSSSYSAPRTKKDKKSTKQTKFVYDFDDEEWGNFRKWIDDFRQNNAGM